jgi:hypothetical protein
MMKHYLNFLIITAILISCQSVGADASKGEVDNESARTLTIKDSIEEFKFKGLMELRSFNAKYHVNRNNRPTEFPSTNDSLIKVYRLNCSGECYRAEFKNRISKGFEISRSDLEVLVGILEDSSSYNNSTAACYDPGFGLVVYDADGVPSEFLSICMNCNSARTFPGQLTINFENENLHGFSGEARNLLRELIMKWGVDYYGYSSFWDDEAEYKNYLNE